MRFDPGALACETKVHGRGDSADVLFYCDGRLLQLEVYGSNSLTNVALSVPIVPMPDQSSARVLAIKRLINLITSQSMQPMLYPPERRAPRLTKIILAIDCWLDGQTYKDIANHLYGKERVMREWSDPGDHMRDQVRRAVHYGRNLVGGGYRQFLR